MRIFKTKLFNRWAKKADLGDSSLIEAVNEIEQGLVEANLGGNLYKKRVATSTGGKRGGFRTLLAYKKGKEVFFLYGFEKGSKENITDKEEKNLKGFAELYLEFNNRDIQIALKNSELIEVENE